MLLASVRRLASNGCAGAGVLDGAAIVRHLIQDERDIHSIEQQRARVLRVRAWRGANQSLVDSERFAMELQRLLQRLGARDIARHRDGEHAVGLGELVGQIDVIRALPGEILEGRHRLPRVHDASIVLSARHVAGLVDRQGMR